MGRIYENMLGTARIELCGALPESFLNACAINGYELWKLECIDPYTLQMTVYERDVSALEAISAKCMCSLKLMEIKGGSKNRLFLRRRLWLFVFLFAAAAMLLLSSLFIWEIEIHGNSTVSDAEIIRQLSDCGVSEGSFWPGVSAELVRSKMLTALPQLSWMTVNVSGSRAMVLVQERQEKPEIYNEAEGRNIVASQTGIIRKSSVLNGSRLFENGQTVSKGQILVSGIMESIGGDIRLVNSRASIMADTCHSIRLVYPTKMDMKTGEIKKYKRYALKFGKNRINLYLNGRKNIDECDKITTEYKLGWDGLFALPLSLVTEELTVCKKQESKFDISELLYSQQLDKLKDRIDGSLEYSSFSLQESKGLSYLDIHAQCDEDIARSAEIQ